MIFATFLKVSATLFALCFLLGRSAWNDVFMKNQGKQTPRIFVEPARELSVLDEADVLVLGAGPGGVAASIAAARNGASVILVERFG